MASRIKVASAKYLVELEKDHQDVQLQFSRSKKRLYELAPSAMLGQYQFEKARQECVELTKRLLVIEKEIARVTKELDNAVS